MVDDCETPSAPVAVTSDHGGLEVNSRCAPASLGIFVASLALLSSARTHTSLPSSRRRHELCFRLGLATLATGHWATRQLGH
jgi:hypothetical protein